MAASIGLPVISMAVDGAASELHVQLMMDSHQTQQPPLCYEYPCYGISIRAPVFTAMGPLIAITDPSHARKTSHNQPQHGTHTVSLGMGFVVNRSLVDLCNTTIGSGLVKHDVENVDKQDDGAARRLYTHQALYAITDEIGGGRGIRPGFEGLFVWLFVFGEFRAC